MAAICPSCGQEFDVTLFQFGRAVVCDCGRVLREPEHRIELPRQKRPGTRDPNDEQTLLMEELKRKAERVCVLILGSDSPPADIAMERYRLREWCEQVFPDRMDLYDMIYESRFDRLIEQFGDDRD
jgi:hypothetical protein